MNDILLILVLMKLPLIEKYGGLSRNVVSVPIMKNGVVVYEQLFYQSSGKNSGFEGTWFPFNGIIKRRVGGKTIKWYKKGWGMLGNHEECKELRTISDVLCDGNIGERCLIHRYYCFIESGGKHYEMWDLVERFDNSLFLLKISSMFGKGVWNTLVGKAFLPYLNGIDCEVEYEIGDE